MRNILKWYHEIIAISVTLSSWPGGAAVFTPAALWPVYSLNSLPIGTQIQLVQIQWDDTYVFLHNNNEIWTLTITPGSWYELDWVNVNSTPVSSTAITLNDWDTINVAFCLPNYLCFTANTAWSTVQLIKSGSPAAVALETSTDWKNWTTYTVWDTITLTNIWDKVYWRTSSETDTTFTTNAGSYYNFVMTWSIAWSWDVNYLLNKNSTITLSDYCYYSMFNWCTSLTTAPELPATTLSDYCYQSMFKWCTSLTTAPITLPATTLTKSCYYYMFYWCTSLTTAPSLPATTLTNYCCFGMFYWCTSLTTVPSLPATTLTDYCYMYMFYQCSKIKLSTTKTWEYQTAYRIPTTWTWTSWTKSLTYMFSYTWWTFTWEPSINTTYYTSNTVVPAT